MKRKIVIGCIADDFTGASDAASFLQKNGLRTVLYNGIPHQECEENFADAIVIALKSRNSPPGEAVSESLAALDWLRRAGAAQLYIKYCSTFDSTKDGNIGPVVDAAMEKYQIPFTLLCPALPVNGRTVRDGRLYVNGVPLQETHMKSHPLTPMWDDRIAELMREQGKYACMILPLSKMQKGGKYVMELIKEFSRAKPHFYIVPDYYEEEHKELIYGIFRDLPLITGGSGILASRLIGNGTQQEERICRQHSGKTILFAGSCSRITLNQIEDFRSRGHTLVKIDPVLLLKKELSPEILWGRIAGHDQVLVYSGGTEEEVKKAQMFGKEKIAELLENTMSELAKKAVNNGYTQIIAAGGETSGAITKKLGFYSYMICESVAPGVPMMIPAQNQNIRLVLKSGNFGQSDFFERAVKVTEKDLHGEQNG